MEPRIKVKSKSLEEAMKYKKFDRMKFFYPDEDRKVVRFSVKYTGYKNMIVSWMLEISKDIYDDMGRPEEFTASDLTKYLKDNKPAPIN